MKAKELAEILLKDPDCDVTFTFPEPDGSIWQNTLRTFGVTYNDIDRVERVILLGSDGEIK